MRGWIGVARGFVSLAGRGLLSSAALLTLPVPLTGERLGPRGRRPRPGMGVCRSTDGSSRARRSLWVIPRMTTPSNVNPTPKPGSPPGPSRGVRRDRAGDHRQQRDVHLHLLLAHRRRRPLRPRQHGLLHRRRRGKLHRPGRPVVHPRRHGLQLLRPHGVYRELLPLRPRRRLPRRQGGDGRLPGQAVRVGPDVRLRPDRPDQRRVGRSVRHGHHLAVHQTRLRERHVHGAPARPTRPGQTGEMVTRGVPSSWRSW